MRALVALLASLIMPLAAEVVPSPDREIGEACDLLGFAAALSCSTCKSIKDIVANEGLTEECLRCCHEETRSAKKYASARLVYDPRLLSADAELRGFVQDRATDHPALTLQPTLYAKTVLLMSEEGANAADVDTVSVKRWKVDSIADYLNEHL